MFFKLHKKSKRALKLCLITFLYLVFGAIVFGFFEHDADLELRKKLQTARQTMQQKYNFTLEDFTEFEGMVITSIPFSAGYQWKFFPGAFYFCVVVIATVGYGHSCPSTVSGKCFYMLFSLFGIPLGLVMFQSIGERINTVVRLGLVKFCALLTRLGYKSLNEIKTRHLLIVSSTIGTLTIAIGTVVFHKQETWSIFDSFYYCVITLSTIGLGDHVPAQTGERLEKDIVYVLFTLIFILFGLAVFSACINLLILEFMANNNADSAMGRGRRLRRFLSFRRSGSLRTPSTNDVEVPSPKNKAKEQLRRNGSLIDARAVYYSAYASKPINFTVRRQPIKYVDHLVNLHSETTEI
ncbi:Ion transport 2 domain containing protein [Aphelenchoides besseyi]|nr:Ion transport 2 domain containing protein [Aphelenchoides besseyi]